MDDDLDALAARADSDETAPPEVRAALAELLRRAPALGSAIALDRLAREPRTKPSRGLLIDPDDAVYDRWLRRVAAAAALIESAAVVAVFAEVRDELAEDVDLAADVRRAATVHPSLPAQRRAQLAGVRTTTIAG